MSGHLRMFGCFTYSHVPSEKRTKLEPTTEKGSLVGYSETTKGYRIYLPAQRKLVVRRDVRFEANRAFRKTVELRDRESQAPELQQDIVQGAVPQVVGASSTGTSGTPGSGVSQVTGSGMQGVRLIPAAGAGTQVTGQGTRGSSGESTGAGSAGAGSGSQRAGVGPTQSSSPGRDAGRFEEQPANVVIPQEVTSGRRRPKWLQDTLREAREAGEPERIMRRGKAPERFCSYIASVTSITNSESSSFQEAVDQQVWREAMVEEYDSIVRNDVWEVVP